MKNTTPVWLGFVILLAVLTFYRCNSSPTNQSPTPTATPIPRPWYAGGTLHNKTIADWQTASDEDKLATSADWMVAGLHVDISKYSEPDLKILALGMQDCVDQLSQPLIENHLITSTLSSVAALCAVTMEKELPIHR